MPEATMALSEDQFERIAEQGWRIAVAESLTGGLLADAFVSVSGASSVFSGGIVAYDTALKHSVLGVDEQLLIDSGPVHPDVARQMARHVRSVCQVRREQGEDPLIADIGLATTGVAGPDPDPQTGQPVGTVWLGISSRLGDRAVSKAFDGDRQAIREATVREILVELAHELEALGLKS